MAKPRGKLICPVTVGAPAAMAVALLFVNGCDRPALTADADVLAVIEQPRTDEEQTAMIDLGRRTYLRNSCHNCHALDGKVGNGAPQLRNLYTTQAQLTDGTTLERDRAYLVGSILRPNDHIVAGHAQQMTAGYRFLPPEEVAAMVVYLEQFSPTPAKPTTEPAAATPDEPDSTAKSGS